MSKYSVEFKMKVVNEYLQGVLGYGLLARKYNIPSNSTVAKWVKDYRLDGTLIPERKSGHSSYSINFKLDVLHYMKTTGSSLYDTAHVFGIPEPSTIWQWNHIFTTEGADALSKTKGRPAKEMNNKKKSKKQNKGESVSKEKQMEREIELLRLEVEWLKKLRDFQSNSENLKTK
jgi:transposase